MRAQKRQHFLRPWLPSLKRSQLVEDSPDLCSQGPVRHGRAGLRLAALGQLKLHGLPIGSGDGAGADLSEIVVLGLQPKERHAANSGLGLDGARHGYRRDRLVECVERAKEKSHLLPGRHDSNPAGLQGIQIRLAGRARGQGRLLLAQNLDQSGRRLAPSREPGHPLPFGRFAKPRRKERVCSRLTREVGIRKCAAHFWR